MQKTYQIYTSKFYGYVPKKKIQKYNGVGVFPMKFENIINIQ